MNRDQKAAVIDEVAAQIRESDAVFAVDYRGISVQQVAELRRRLGEADATLRVVKNTLTERAADKAGAEPLKALLDGPTAFTFVRGDAALAAKAIATFRRQHSVPEFKGGTMDGAALSIEELQAIALLPAREVLHGQLVGTLASPITGLARTLNQLIQGLALQLGQIAEQGLIGEEAPASGEEAPAAEEAAAAEAVAKETEQAPAAQEEMPAPEASGDEPADNDETETPAEGDEEAKEG
jgi:large subunit ribosomal protein L10